MKTYTYTVWIWIYMDAEQTPDCIRLGEDFTKNEVLALADVICRNPKIVRADLDTWWSTDRNIRRDAGTPRCLNA